jgi:UrcA family protein
MTRTLSTALVAALCLAAAANTAPAYAQDVEAPASVSVRTADLDLSNPGDRRVLMARADAAAEALCCPTLTFHRLNEIAALDCRVAVRSSVRAEADRRSAPVRIASR